MLDNDCQIRVGESIGNLNRFLINEKNIVITDPNVRLCHGRCFEDFECIEIALGETSKSLETLEKIFDRFLEMEVDHSCSILGIGGGIVCDVAGFAASTYRNGLDFGFVPTSLLAQVDACIGGRISLNYKDNKNLFGATGQPRFVLVDTDLLHTLPEKEFQGGLAEAVKHAVIRSPFLFEYLEQEWPALLNHRREALIKVINESIMIKSWLVQSEAVEKGERDKLKFGHILGQHLERTERLTHGESMSLGMAFASRISAARGMLSSSEADSIEQLLNKLKLPTGFASYKGQFLQAIENEKKRSGEEIRIVLLNEIGRAEVDNLSFRELEDRLHELC